MPRRLISTGSPFEKTAGYSRAVIDGGPPGVNQSGGRVTGPRPGEDPDGVRPTLGDDPRHRLRRFLGWNAGGGHAARAQHGAAVAQRADLIQLVADVQDAAAFGRESP